MKALYAAIFVLLTGCFVEGPAADQPDVSMEEQPSITPLGFCGNNICESPERPETCPSDCSVCGDGLCLPHEHQFCPEDCCFTEPCTGR